MRYRTKLLVAAGLLLTLSLSAAGLAAWGVSQSHYYLTRSRLAHEQLVTEYLEGAMPPAEAKALERHLTACPGCTEYLEQMRSTAGSLPSLREDALPPAIREELIEAFRRSRP
jgi:hypothetical protein